MIALILSAPHRLPLWVHVLVTAAAFGLFQTTKTALDAHYAASGHPVDYVTGQTAFDAERVEGWYTAMQAQGTLDLYVQTQIIDFGFIAAVMLLGMTLGTLVARLGRDGSLGRRLGLWAAGFAVIGGMLDSVENLLSFAMLAQPDAIPQALAVAYSSAAAAKFAMLTAAMGTLALSFGFGLWSRMRG